MQSHMKRDAVLIAAGIPSGLLAGLLFWLFLSHPDISEIVSYTLPLLMALLAGIVSGVAASFLSRRVLLLCDTPKIEIFDYIGKTESSGRGCGFAYRIKFYNARKRNAVDLRLNAIAIIPDLVREGTNQLREVPLGSHNIMELLPVATGGRTSRITVLNLEEEQFTKALQTSIYPPQIQKLAQDRTLSLESILDMKEGSRLKLRIRAADSITGLTKTFSMTYYRDDIVAGPFEKGSRRVVPKNEPT